MWSGNLIWLRSKEHRSQTPLISLNSPKAVNSTWHKQRHWISIQKFLPTQVCASLPKMFDYWSSPLMTYWTIWRNDPSNHFSFRERLSPLIVQSWSCLHLILYHPGSSTGMLSVLSLLWCVRCELFLLRLAKNRAVARDAPELFKAIERRDYV